LTEFVSNRGDKIVRREDRRAAAGAGVAGWGRARRQGATMPFETNPVEKMIANEPDTILIIIERLLTECTIWVVIRVLEPCKVGLHHTFCMRGHHAMFADIDSMLETELVCNFPFRAFAQPHRKATTLERSLKKCYQA